MYCVRRSLAHRIIDCEDPQAIIVPLRTATFGEEGLKPEGSGNNFRVFSEGFMIVEKRDLRNHECEIMKERTVFFL